MLLEYSNRKILFLQLNSVLVDFACDSDKLETLLSQVRLYRKLSNTEDAVRESIHQDQCDSTE